MDEQATAPSTTNLFELLTSTHLVCQILGDPVGQGRPRAVRVGPFVRVHAAPKSASWQAVAAERMAEVWAGRSPLDEPVRVTIDAVGRRPKSAPKRRPGRLWRVTKPDADNVAKAACDALVKAGVLRDDTLVGELVVHSLVADVDEGPAVVVRVEALPALPPQRTRAVEVSP